jgi:hypothetical protein
MRLFMNQLASATRRSLIKAERYPDHARFYVDVQGHTKEPGEAHPRGESDYQRNYREQLNRDALKAIEEQEKRDAKREGREPRPLTELVKPECLQKHLDEIAEACNILTHDE